MSHYQRRRVSAVAISTHVKPVENNTKKYAFHFKKSSESCAFGGSAARFDKSHYYLEDGDPGGGNQLLNPKILLQHTGEYSLRNDATGHGPTYEKSSVKGWGSPQDAVKGNRGWCGGVHHSSFAPPAVDPLLLKNSNLMRIAGNETRLQELAKLRDSKMQHAPGPGTYNLAGGPITRKSYSRPDNSGPKKLVEGQSLRSLEIARQWRSGGLDGEVGPGTYDAAFSVDKTQSRRLQQPVISNWKKRYTTKAECLSVTLLAGHHWKEKVPRLGEGDESRPPEGGLRADGEPSAASVSSIRSAMDPETYKKYARQQRLLDARLSQPKTRQTMSPLVVPRLYTSSGIPEHRDGYYAAPFDAWNQHDSPERDASLYVHQQQYSSFASPYYAEGAGQDRHMPMRAPSAPPQEVYDAEFDGARAHGLRTERSERSHMGLHTVHEESTQRVRMDYHRADARRREATKAATKAMLAEQRKMDWHVRSSHGASWGPWEDS